MDSRNQMRLCGNGCDRERHERAGDEAAGRRQCGLDRTRLESRGDPELVAGVRFQGIMRHQLGSRLSGKSRLEPLRDVDVLRVRLRRRSSVPSVPV